MIKKIYCQKQYVFMSIKMFYLDIYFINIINKIILLLKIEDRKLEKLFTMIVSSSVSNDLDKYTIVSPTCPTGSRELTIVRFHRSNLKCWCGKHFFSYINRTAISRSPLRSRRVMRLWETWLQLPPIGFIDISRKNVKVVFPKRRIQTAIELRKRSAKALVWNEPKFFFRQNELAIYLATI